MNMNFKFQELNVIFNTLVANEGNNMDENLENLIYPPTKIPFMFRLPENEEAFITRHFPGNYNDLVGIYGEGGIVSEMSSFKLKTVCELKGIDGSNHCHLIELKDEKSNPTNYKIVFKIINL